MSVRIFDNIRFRNTDIEDILHVEIGQVSFCEDRDIKKFGTLNEEKKNND